MKDKVFVLFLICFFADFEFCINQKLARVDSIDYYIEKLNWGSFTITTKYFREVYLFDDAKKIVSLKNKHKIKKLIQRIAIPEKTVTIHLILTQMLNPDKRILDDFYIRDENLNIVGHRYMYNNLTWEEMGYGNEKKYILPQEEIDKVKKYWLKESSTGAR